MTATALGKCLRLSKPSAIRPAPPGSQRQNAHGKNGPQRGQCRFLLGVEDVALLPEELFGPSWHEHDGDQPFDQLVDGARGDDKFGRQNG